MIKLFFLASALIISTCLSAQSYSWWTWSNYNLKFKTPDDFKLIANNGDEFKAQNDCIGFEIYPRKGERLSYKEMKSALRDWAGQNGLNLYGDPIHISNINGYWGVGVVATYRGTAVYLFLLVDPYNPDISFYVWFDFAHSEDVETCLTIIKSFTPY